MKNMEGEKSKLVISSNLKNEDLELGNSENDLKGALQHFLDEGSFLGFECPISSQDLGGSRCLLDDESFINGPATLEKTEPFYRFYWTSIGLIREAVDTGIYSIPEPPEDLRPTQRILTICEALHHIPPYTLMPMQKSIPLSSKKPRRKPLVNRLLDKWQQKREKFTSI